MAFAMTYIQPNASSTALFQGWGSGISGLMAAAGMVKTADTGQINWTTVAVGTVVNTAVGYEIWRLNDTLQATAPVFLKIEYGSASPVTIPSLWFTVGAGTDGAGNLTGIMVARRQAAFGSFNANSYPSQGAGDTSSFVVAIAPASGGAAFTSFFGLERTRNASGVPTGEGIFFFHSYFPSNFQTYWVIVPYGQLDTNFGTVWNNTAPIFVPTNIGGTTTFAGSSAAKDWTTTPALLIPLFGAAVTPWTSQLLAVVLPGDLGPGGTVQLTVNGTAHTYRAISAGFNTGGIIPYAVSNVPTTIYPVILWE